MLIIGTSICITIIVSWITAKIIVTKHLKVIDGYVKDCTDQINRAVIEMICCNACEYIRKKR